MKVELGEEREKEREKGRKKKKEEIDMRGPEGEKRREEESGV